MKSLRPIHSGFFLVLLLLVTSIPVTAQQNEDQQHKKHYNSGLEAAKDAAWSDARDLFMQAVAGADEASDSETAQLARYRIAQMDYQLGREAYKAGDFESALQHYSNGESTYPAYVRNLYEKGSTLEKLGRIDEAIDSWMAAAAAPRDRKTNLAAEKKIRDHFMVQASTAVGGKRNATRSDADVALAALASLSELMEPDADVYYYTAVAHYIKGEGDAAISAAQQALDIHTGSRSDKAKIYYVLGEAYVSVNDRTAAREAFQNAAYGAYKQSAEHYLETL